MNDVLDFADACKYLKLAPATLYRHVRCGAIPGFKVGRIWRFKKDNLDQWMNQQTANETASRTKKNV